MSVSSRPSASARPTGTRCGLPTARMPSTEKRTSTRSGRFGSVPPVLASTLGMLDAPLSSPPQAASTRPAPTAPALTRKVRREREATSRTYPRLRDRWDRALGQRRADHRARRVGLAARLVARPATPHVPERRLQPSRSMRLLHRACRWSAPRRVRDSGRADGRARSHDVGRPRRRDTRSMDGRLHRDRREPVRLLHSRDHHAAVHPRPPRRGDRRAGAARAPVPLHRLADHHRGGDRSHGGTDGGIAP